MAVHLGRCTNPGVGCLLCGSCRSDPGDVGAGKMLMADRTLWSGTAMILSRPKERTTVRARTRTDHRGAAAPRWEIRCSSLREVGAASDPKKLRALLAVVRSRLVNGRHGHFVSLNLRCPFDYFRQDSLHIRIGCAKLG